MPCKMRKWEVPSNSRRTSKFTNENLNKIYNSVTCSSKWIPVSCSYIIFHPWKSIYTLGSSLFSLITVVEWTTIKDRTEMSFFSLESQHATRLSSGIITWWYPGYYRTLKISQCTLVNCYPSLLSSPRVRRKSIIKRHFFAFWTVSGTKIPDRVADVLVYVQRQ